MQNGNKMYRYRKRNLRTVFCTAGFLAACSVFFLSCASSDAPPEMFIDYSNERSLRYEMEQIASLTLTDSVQALVRARNLHDYVSAAGSEDKPQYSRELAEETEELYADTLRLVEENFYTAVSDGDWTDAINDMNKALPADFGWQYVKGEDGLPVLVKTE